MNPYNKTQMQSASDYKTTVLREDHLSGAHIWITSHYGCTSTCVFLAPISFNLSKFSPPLLPFPNLLLWRKVVPKLLNYLVLDDCVQNVLLWVWRGSVLVKGYFPLV